MCYNVVVPRFTQLGKIFAAEGESFGEKKLRRPKTMFAALFALSLAALPGASVFAEGLPTPAQFAAKGFPDNADLRGKLFAYVIGASRDLALKQDDKQYQSSAAGQVTVRVENRANDFVVRFLNPVPSGAVAGRGSCYILRSNAKGNYIQQARILLEDDPSCYLALYPSGSGTRGDVVMYGAVVKKGLYFSDMLYRILLLSFSDIVDATSRSFDWAAVFKFGGKGPAFDYLAELRSSLAVPAAPAEAPSATAAPIAVSRGQGRMVFAAAPTLPPPSQAEASAKVPRSSRIAALVEKAASFEALTLELGASGESGIRELSLAPDATSGFLDDRGEIAKLVYGDYPRYDSKGLSLSALRSALFLDLAGNPDSVYAVVGDGLHATVVPCFDDTGKLAFSFFQGGKETSWDDLSSGRRDLKVRVLRVPANG
jgi:hypothetical protein